MKKVDFFKLVASRMISLESSDEDALFVMIVLHNFCVHVAPDIKLDDAGKERVLMPLTRQHASEILASCFPRADRDRSNDSYWYKKYVETVPDNSVATFPEVLRRGTEATLVRLRDEGLITDCHEDN